MKAISEGARFTRIREENFSIYQDWCKRLSAAREDAGSNDPDASPSVRAILDEQPDYGGPEPKEVMLAALRSGDLRASFLEGMVVREISTEAWQVLRLGPGAILDGHGKVILDGGNITFDQGEVEAFASGNVAGQSVSNSPITILKKRGPKGGKTEKIKELILNDLKDGRLTIGQLNSEKDQFGADKYRCARSTYFKARGKALSEFAEI
jgi:hypothetical protein